MRDGRVFCTAGWMASNVAVETDAAGNIKPSKKKSTERIDGIVAGVMALGRSLLQPEKPCQTFWTAVAVYAVTRGVGDLTAWLFTAAACSGAAVLASTLGGSVKGNAPGSASRAAGCKNCGS